ncbi:hypothetical protein RRG08_007564 [Elysia crispata]|uniref:Uncharacterized protein n=1 Tax=Elysia crispata TaxID=231223 RepID=A0AAE0Z2P3_9GAST|nr:hypothetical protein RRG08_007564 [Elysia crispata]
MAEREITRNQRNGCCGCGTDRRTSLLPVKRSTGWTDWRPDYCVCPALQQFCSKVQIHIMSTALKCKR